VTAPLTARGHPGSLLTTATGHPASIGALTDAAAVLTGAAGTTITVHSPSLALPVS
jgi:hypothetical protein